MKENNMKKYMIFLSAMVILAGCNDDFMNRLPKDSIVEENFWNSEGELNQYVNAFYPLTAAFAGHETYFTLSKLISGDLQSDNLVPVNYNAVAAGEYVMPATGGGWTWEYIRRANYFLNRYQKAAVTDEIKNAKAAEVKVFKSLEYFQLVKRFGDVPWLSNDLNTDSPELFKPRDSRALVMDSVLVDLDWAIEHLPAPQGPAAVTINRHVALAVKARICLHEGTFRKYHGIAGSEKFLALALEASGQLIGAGTYRLFTTGNPEEDYATVFGSLDLAGNPEIILYRRYEPNLLGNGTVRTVHDNSIDAGASKSLIESYLCIDGKPIGISPLYKGDGTIEDELTSRDPRLTQTFVYPRTKMQKGFPGPAIPGTDFASSSLSAGICPTGYQLAKYWRDDQVEYLRIQQGILDAPLIRYAEILLIHAEAAAEMGTADQALLDKTINLLRGRAGVGILLLSEVESWRGNSKYLSDYSNINSALLNEIRRERRVELAVENFRYDDLVRWKEGKLLEKTVRGMKFVQSVYPRVEVGKDIFLDNEGYILPYSKSLPNGRVFNESKHYLFPIPTEELILNPNLVQNPGW